MQQPQPNDVKRENHTFVAFFLLGLIGIALRVTELAGLWSDL